MSYELKSARFLAREILERIVRPGDAVIDATMGNGHDTVFLCRAAGPSGRVYAFDIQEQAVISTASLLRQEGLTERAQLFCCGHEQMVATLCLFEFGVNLGWLPG